MYTITHKTAALNVSTMQKIIEIFQLTLTWLNRVVLFFLSLTKQVGLLSLTYSSVALKSDSYYWHFMAKSYIHMHKLDCSDQHCREFRGTV